MAITTLLDPALLPGRTMDQDTFNAAMAYLMTNLPIWGQQTNALQATLNSLAAGGAYALPYTFSSSASEVDPGSGKLGLSSTPQTSSVALRVNTTNSAGVDSLSLLNDFNASTSSVTGTVRLQKVGDPSKWLVFAVTAAVQYTGYMRLTVIGRGGSAASPFVAGDSLMLFFQRTGDKGDTGYTLPSIYVRHEATSGTASDTVSGGVWPTRTLNTVKWNDLSGSSLSANQVTLPAGTYEIEASAPGYKLGGHKIRLYNVTDGSVVEVGTNAYADNTYSGMSRSYLRCRVTIGAAKAFRIEHFSGATSSTPAANGAIEVYSELKATKVA